MKLKFPQGGSLHGSGARNAVICGRGLQNELYILQHEEEAPANVIHGTSAAASAASTPPATAMATHPAEGSMKESTAIDGGLEDSWLQISPMEAEIALLSMKLELLQVENHRIKADLASESLGAKRELQAARLKIKHLKRRLQSSRAQARKKTESLNRKIAQSNENEEVGGEVSKKTKELDDLPDAAEELRKANLIVKQESLELEQSIKMKELENLQDAAEELRKANLMMEENLEMEQQVEVLLEIKEPEDSQRAAQELSKANLLMKQENMELEQKMDSAKMLISGIEEDHQSEASEEINHLRELNDQLHKEIEKLEAKQKAEADEVRHLRWLNAKLMSDELSFTYSSPAVTKTGDKGRQKCMSPTLVDDFKHTKEQPQQYNSPQGSIRQFSACSDQTSLEKSINDSRKPKIFCKFKKLVTRKNSKDNCCSFSTFGEVEPERERSMSSNDASGKSSGSASACSEEASSGGASSCVTTEEQPMASPTAGSATDADEMWSSSSAWITRGAFRARYAVQAEAW